MKNLTAYQQNKLRERIETLRHLSENPAYPLREKFIADQAHGVLRLFHGSHFGVVKFAVAQWLKVVRRDVEHRASMLWNKTILRRSDEEIEARLMGVSVEEVRRFNEILEAE